MSNGASAAETHVQEIVDRFDLVTERETLPLEFFEEAVFGRLWKESQPHFSSSFRSKGPTESKSIDAPSDVLG